jgi:putative peptidoglycan lipid II flippase
LLYREMVEPIAAGVDATRSQFAPNFALRQGGVIIIVSRVTDSSRFLAPARVIAGLTAGSRILGLFREVAYGYYFGVDPLFSSFRVAFMVPNLARRLFGEGAMASAFVPVFSEVLVREGRERGKGLSGAAFTLLTCLLIALTLLSELGLGLAYLARPSHTISLTMLMLPYMILICLAGFSGGMLNSLNRFAIPAAAPVLLNVIMIAVLLLGGAWLKLGMGQLIYLSAVAVLLCGVAQFGAQVVDMFRADFRPRLNWHWRDPALVRILRLMGPMLIGLSALQLSVLADNLIALFFVPNGRGPSVLGYAHMLYHLPQGVFGIALATAIFPLLSTKAAEGDREGLARAIEAGTRINLFIAVPASVGLIVLATPIVSAIYHHKGGAFTAADTPLVASTLLYYCVGLWAFCAYPLLARAFYAVHDSRTPVRVGVVTVALNLALSFMLVFPMAEGGIALATAITASIQVFWMAWALQRHLPEIQWRPVMTSLGRTLAAAAIMGLLLGVARLPAVAERLHEVWLLVLAIPAGVAVFAVSAKLLRCAEFGELVSRRVKAD